MADQRLESNAPAQDNGLFAAGLTIGATVLAGFGMYHGGKAAWKGSKNVAKKVASGTKNVAAKTYDATVGHAKEMRSVNKWNKERAMNIKNGGMNINASNSAVGKAGTVGNNAPTPRSMTINAGNSANAVKI